MSIDQTQAERKAREYINSIASFDGEYELVSSRIREESDGWYFPYQSAEFLRTGDFNKSLVGNWPIFVSRDGQCIGPRRPGMPFVSP
ncbi:YrhB domain-containing protein [Ralstonia pseudosolanacearum]|uniref:YrhB domain-containing protein n=1 Tax=Ralstonia pseudosolanacearum TaxID=1310165 RepID=UPI0018D054C9